jgi:D-cysteine desulfhydrase
MVRSEIWMKNDGLYGTVYGGNKPRKLEFILADALANGATTLITGGALGTNHGLATALYGREAGLRIVLLLTYQHRDEEVVRQEQRMRDAGAIVHYTSSLPLTGALLPYFALRYREDGRWPYMLMPGGSSPVGTLGFVNAGLELAEQVRRGELPEPSTIALPLGTGGTAAGLLLGLRLAGLESEVLAVGVTRAPTAARSAVIGLARAAGRLLERRGAKGASRVALDGLEVTRRWIRPGYGQPCRRGEEARKVFAETEGIKLDSTYTARAAAALLAGCRSQAFPGPVLYWHTYNAIPLP